MTDLTLGDHQFILGKMPVRKQFHVARRLAPLFSSFVGQQSAEGARASLADLQIQPIAQALAGMEDADCDYVLDACLSVVKLMQDGRAVPIMSTGGQMMFGFITMPQMLQIAAEVVMQDLSAFMVAAPSTSPSQAAA